MLKFKFKKASISFGLTFFVNAGIVLACAFIFHSIFAGTISSVAITTAWLVYLFCFCRKREHTAHTNHSR